MFTLAISCLTTSSLPWFMYLTFQVPMQYCSLQHWTLLLSPVSSTMGCCFLLWLHPFILCGVISPLISSSILGTYRPGDFMFQCPIFLHFILLMRFSRQEYWSGLPFPSPVDLILSELSTMTHLFWVAHMARLSFTELDKALSMWSDWLVVCDCGFSLSALWSPLSAPTILLGFLLPWTRDISSGLLQQSAATAPDLECGVAPLCRCS